MASQTHRVDLTAREIATISAALGEYLYLAEEGAWREFVEATDSFKNHQPLTISEAADLREQLERACPR